MSEDAALFFPFEVLAEQLARGEPFDSAIAHTAAHAGIAPARLRAGAESHPDLVHVRAEPRICRGTSCELAGARALADSAPAARRAYCLGACDRAPAMLDARGALHARVTQGSLERALGGELLADAAPSVRALDCEPIVTRRIARGDFSELGEALRDGAYQALRRATMALAPEGVIDLLARSGERGRGGAGFPTAAKWRACARAPGSRKVAIANGDEGDPGSFADRALMELDPHAVLEGLALCAFAIGARDAVVFVRSEYPRAAERMRAALAQAEAARLLGDLRVRIVRGFGSYVCGEETALIAALEGERAEARPRPPFPVEQGLFGWPTVVNNVETLANVAWIVMHGAERYAALGSPGSPGTKLLSLSAGFRAPGLLEVPFGISLRSVIERGAETRCSRDALEGVLLGGPMGCFVRPEQCDVALDPDALRRAGLELGHGGLVAVPRGADLAALAQHLAAFAADESCGRCTPCRAGSARLRELFADASFALRSRGVGPEVGSVLESMERASLCAFGRAVPRPLRGVLAALAEPRA